MTCGADSREPYPKPTEHLLTFVTMFQWTCCWLSGFSFACAIVCFVKNDSPPNGILCIGMAAMTAIASWWASKERVSFEKDISDMKIRAMNALNGTESK